MMAAEKTREVERQQADVKEFVELLKKLTAEEKREVKGIMIGHARSAESEDCMTIDTACVGSGAG